MCRCGQDQSVDDQEVTRLADLVEGVLVYLVSQCRVIRALVTFTVCIGAPPFTRADLGKAGKRTGTDPFCSKIMASLAQTAFSHDGSERHLGLVRQRNQHI